VKAAAGRRVPIHASVARGIGGAQLFVEGDDEIDLPDVGFVRRRIAVGDLELVAPVPSPSKPSAPIATPAKETP
jgi:hypothetical protein